MRKSPPPSCKNGNNQEFNCTAPSAFEDDAQSLQQGAEIARYCTRPAYEICRCSADGSNPCTHHKIKSVGDTNTSAQQAPCRRTRYFPEALSKASEPSKPYFPKALSKGSEPTKPTASTDVAESFAANSGSEDKRSHGRICKKSRMVWSEDLHNQFLKALTDIGLRHAVPKLILQVRSARLLSAFIHCSVRRSDAIA
jgi:SHAQKYF class myb-like DNA-binding protein